MNTRTDFYLNKERIAHRKFMLWDLMQKHRNIKFAAIWFRDLLWSAIAGYGTRPSRTILAGIVISILYAVLYFTIGAPIEPDNTQSNIYSSLYFSFTTFATLGYGDLSYRSIHPIMRLISTSEAWVGHVMISLFVVVVARKIIRR